MAINNSKELENIMNKKIEAVLDEVSEKVYKKLEKIIQEEVYKGARPKIYQRTYDFLKAFELGDLKKYSDKMTREIFYNWKTMTPPQAVPKNSETDEGYKNYIHGNYAEGIDRRKDLWWILSNDQDNRYYSDFDGALNVDVDGYLKVLDAYMRDDFWKWVRTAAKRQGLKVV